MNRCSREKGLREHGTYDASDRKEQKREFLERGQVGYCQFADVAGTNRGSGYAVVPLQREQVKTAVTLSSARGFGFLFLPITFYSFFAAPWASPEDATSITPRVRTSDADKDANSPVVEKRAATLRVDTTLVQINVTVSDPLNRFVDGLEKEHFRLFEDKVEQTILHLSRQDTPLSIVLVFDTSASMGPKLQRSRQAAAQFFKTANPEDEFSLIEFNDRPRLVVPFTTETTEIQNRLTFAQAKGSTALFDGVYMAMNQVQKARNPRKAILIISDGGDNHSRYTEGDVKNAVQESDVQIYGIGIFEPMVSRARAPEEMMGPGVISKIAEWTGGRCYDVQSLKECSDIAAKIGLQLRNQYVLYYSSQNHTRDGKYRHVTLKLVQPRGLPRLKAFYRRGYCAPSQ